MDPLFCNHPATRPATWPLRSGDRHLDVALEKAAQHARDTIRLCRRVSSGGRVRQKRMLG
jgi:hypothetical protein